MRCKATQLAFHEGSRVRPGQIVEISGKKVPKWCVRVDEAKRGRGVETAKAADPSESAAQSDGDDPVDLSLV